MAAPLLLAACAPLALAPQDLAEPTPPAAATPLGLEADALWYPSWEHDGRATGDWGGLRTDLAERGFEFEGLALLESSRVVDGGLAESTSTRALWLAATRVDLERVASLSRTTAYAEFYALRGSFGGADTGDYQAYSNADGPTVTQLAELWLEHTTVDGAVRVRAGKFDATAEFCHVHAGLGFLHSSAVLSPTTAEFMPTYPEPAVALAAFASLGEQLDVRVAAFNARDDGVPVSARRTFDVRFEAVFGIAEAGWRWSALGGLGEGRASIGGWYHSGDRLTALDGGGEKTGTGGTYAVVEQRLRELGRGGPGLVAFAQVGRADPDVDPVERHVGFGLVAEGLVPGRESWTTGLYVSRAEFSDRALAGLGDAETAIELFQRIALTPAVTVVPDLQLIVDPSGDGAVDDAVVATLRIEIVL